MAINPMRIMLILPSELITEDISKSYEQYGRMQVAQNKNRFRGVINLPPLGLMYLAAPLAEAGHKVMILDAPTLQLTNGEICQEALAFKPDIIGISFYSMFIRVVHQLTGLLKRNLNVPIILGGPHPTVMPEKVFEEFSDVDFLFRGLGEFSIQHFVEMLQGQTKVEDVLGLAYRENDLIRMNPQADLPENEDDIPLPYRAPLCEIYDHHLYFNIMSNRKNMDVLLTSRNCLFRCNFCFQHGTYFEHSPNRVLKEIREMVNRGINAIEIMDDSFTLNRKRFDAIIDQIISNRSQA